MYNSSSSDKAKTYCMYIGDIERRWTLKEIWTAGWFMVSVYLNIAPPFVLIRVMLLVYTNTSVYTKELHRDTSDSRKS